MPALVGADGVECIVPLELSEEEQVALYKSSLALKKIVDEAL